MLNEITSCRICSNRSLESVIDLGVQYLTGVFPTPLDADKVAKGPLELVLCAGEQGCGLVQLRHSYPPGEMYGESYGYRSGLNPTMVSHLGQLVARAREIVELRPGDAVLDIGSNDGTTLGFFDESFKLIGIDPAATKYERFYRPDIERVSDFFSANVANRALGGQKAKLILSIAMMYDLEDPVAFAREVAQCLSPDGLWIFEQSYLPSMVDKLAYDTICHEHIEYYGVRQLDRILREAGLKIVGLNFNESNGGSVCVLAAHDRCKMYEARTDVGSVIEKEIARGFGGTVLYKQFADRISQNRTMIRTDLAKWKHDRKVVFGLGASTKGNVLLQYLNISPDDIPIIGDINPDKHGHVTPGTMLPIISEEECVALRPDVFFVLPWHFSSFFERAPHLKGSALYFPLPSPRLVPPRSTL